VLRVEERAPTLPSTIFTFGFVVESIKELGGITHTNEQDKKIDDYKYLNPNVFHFMFMFTVNFNKWRGIINYSWNVDVW
jgi:hypothetical protein